MFHFTQSGPVAKVLNFPGDNQSMTLSFEKLESGKFTKAVTTAVVGVVILLFGLNFAIPFLIDVPEIQLWVLKGIKVAAFTLAALIALYVFPLIQHIKNVKNGASLFPVPHQKQRYQPWPAHSHPVARKAKWGPVEQDYEVHGKKTRLAIKSEGVARQKPSRIRTLFLMFLLVTGVLLALFPIVVGSLVYEITPPEVEALQQLASEMRVLFFPVSLILLGFALFCFCSRTRLAVFDKSGISSITSSRCLGLLDKVLKPEAITFDASDVSGLQIAHHRSKSIKVNDRRIDQYELILVFSDSTRHLLTKSHRQQAILSDAIKLAKFLGVNVWDRSTHYQPDLPSIVSPVDAVIQPL